MPYNVTFTLVDIEGRETTKTWHTTAANETELDADIAAMVTAIEGISKTSVSKAAPAIDPTTYVANPEAGSNIDAGATFRVLAEDGYKNVLKIPDPEEDVKAGGGAINLASAEVIAFLGQFGGANRWHLNPRNPVQITTTLTGTLDV